MSVSSGRLEEEILTLERQVWQLPDRHALGVRLVALEQQLAQLWSGAGFPPAVTGPPPPPPPCNGNIFAITRDQCNTANGQPGVTVTVTQGSTTIGSGTSSRGVKQVTLTAGGSGYTTAPTVVFSTAGGTGAAATATISGGTVTAIKVTNPGSGYTGNPVISFTGGGGSGAGASVVMDTLAMIAIPAAGTYTVTAGGTGFTTSSTTVTAACSANTQIQLNLYKIQNNTRVNVSLCNQTNTAITITVTQTTGGAFVASGTLDSSMGVSFSLPPSINYTFTASVPSGRIAGSTTFTPVACPVPAGSAQVISLAAVPATGYACHWACNTPIATTLFLTDHHYGVVVTLTYQSGGTNWVGTDAGSGRVYTVNGVNPGGGAATLQITAGDSAFGSLSSASCPPSSVLLTYATGGGTLGYVSGDTFTVTE